MTMMMLVFAHGKLWIRSSGARQLRLAPRYVYCDFVASKCQAPSWYMQQIFLSRDAAVRRLLSRKRELLSEAMQPDTAESDAHVAADIAEIERLLLDVKAGRVNDFEFVEHGGAIVHVYVS
jgi:hypothetical protein